MNLLNNISFNNPELFFLLILPLVHALWYFFSKNNIENVLLRSGVASEASISNKTLESASAPSFVKLPVNKLSVI